MELITFCKACKEEIKVKSSATTRPELERDKGEEFIINCSHCGKDNQRHVNDIRARENKAVMMIAGALGIVLALVLFFIVGVVGTIVIVIPGLIWQQQRQAASTFNRYLLPRR